jgi:hypothetical protein
MCLVLITIASALRAGDIPTELTARQLKLKGGEATLSEILTELEKQTGNPIADRRTAVRKNLKLTLKPGTFWQTLDAIGEQTGIAFTPHGGVALVDTPYRKLHTSYTGAFRFSIKSVTVTRDDELQTHHGHASVTIAWEPRFAPMYLNLKSAEVAIGKKNEAVPGGGTQEVLGAGAARIDFAYQAPPRNVARIDAIKGEVRFIGAPKMLEFAFAKLGPISDKNLRESESQDGVKVRLTEVKQLTGRWVVRLHLVYPDGAIAGLESFQLPYWTNNNRVWLSWSDSRTKSTHTLEPDGDAYQDVKDGRIIQYTFTPQGDTPLPPKTADVTLRCRTPNRVLAFTVPFAFRDLPLP